MNPLRPIWNFLYRSFHRLGSPREFYTISRYATPIFGALFFGLTAIGSYLGLFVAPADYQQGDSYRIIFVHVPAAWLSLFIYIVMATASAIGLIWRMKMAFVVAICSAPIGAMFTALALITGSLWGAPIWGTWWEWDARLTSELILLFIYLAVMALYYAFDDRRTAEKAMALLCVVGIVIVPIIHYSVEWWSSLHQGQTVFRDGGPAMPPSMLTPLLLMAGAATFFYGYVLFLNLRAHVLEENESKQWVQDMAKTWIKRG